MSRIGKKPVAVPQGVTVTVKDGTVTVTGPKGSSSRKLHDRIKAEVKDGSIVVSRVSDMASDRALHGLSRALLANMVVGVTQGYQKELEIVGVGFKAQMQGTTLNMSIGFSHPVNFPSPEGITIATPKNTQIVIRGIDKEKVGETAAEIRSIYPPEPYKGKGIRYAGEVVRKKVGKAQATGGGK